MRGGFLFCFSSLQVPLRSRGTPSPSPPGGSRFAAHAYSPITPQLLCWLPLLLTVLPRLASQVGPTARYMNRRVLHSAAFPLRDVMYLMKKHAQLILGFSCVTVTIRVGGCVARARAVGGVCPAARGRAGAADAAVGASTSGSSRGRSSTVLHQNAAGGRHR